LGVTRSRPRWKLAAIGGVLSLPVVLAACSTQHSSATSSTSPARTSTSSRFIRLAEKGADGTFSAKYRVVSATSPFGEGRGRLEMAQRAEAGHNPWSGGVGQHSVGKWSYRLSFDGGADYQWIENGGKAEDCWRTRGHRAFTCYGPFLFQPSIGSSLAIEPYLPGTTLQALEALARGTNPSEANHLTTLEDHGDHMTGRLVCLRDRTKEGTGTWCFTESGWLGSFLGTGHVSSAGFSRISLISKASTAPANDFHPEGRLESGFRLPPSG
jgi:hypothetical protein